VRAARAARDARIGGGVDHRRRLAVGVELVHRERRIAPRGMGSASRSTTTLSPEPETPGKPPTASAATGSSVWRTATESTPSACSAWTGLPKLTSVTTSKSPSRAR
jgi:hypothetical protein